MLHVEDVSVSFDGMKALDGASLEAAAGRTLAVLGPSGCGKTTLLRAIAGLQPLDSGRVRLGGDDLAGTAVHRRGIGLMFQDNALFPHRDVAGNVSFGLRMAGLPRREVEQRTRELLELVGLPGSGARAVQTLSGGEQQRIALARAVAPNPKVLLLDEPLGSLDGPLRERLLADLRELYAAMRLTVVYVTHHAGEAFSLGHAIAVMRQGKVVQVAAPDDLWQQPADGWVARFLGMRNVRDEGERSVVTRPEAVAIVEGDDAVVTAVDRRGAVIQLRVRLHDGRELETVTTATEHPRVGDRVGVLVDPTAIVEVPSWHQPSS
jgi:thiamine transport system ATP-binding protein